MNKIITYMYNDGINYTDNDFTIEETKIILEEHEKTLWRIYKYLEEKDYDCEDIYNLGDVINLIIGIKEELK